MPTPSIWGFLGLFAGPWKLAILAAVALTLFGGRLRPLTARWLSTSPTRQGAHARPASRFSFSDRVFLFFLVLAATALASWIVTHMMVHQSAAGRG